MTNAEHESRAERASRQRRVGHADGRPRARWIPALGKESLLPRDGTTKSPESTDQELIGSTLLGKPQWMSQGSGRPLRQPGKPTAKCHADFWRARILGAPLTLLAVTQVEESRASQSGSEEAPSHIRGHVVMRNPLRAFPLALSTLCGSMLLLSQHAAKEECMSVHVRAALSRQCTTCKRASQARHSHLGTPCTHWRATCKRACTRALTGHTRAHHR